MSQDDLSPAPATIEDGDLLWPKHPGVVIVYLPGAAAAPDLRAEKARWEAEKQAFVERVRQAPEAMPEDRKAAETLERLSFGEFLARYGGEAEPGGPQPYGQVAEMVGHVALVHREGRSQPWVVEAVGDGGVVERPYAAWLDRWGGDVLVCHGRLKDFDAVGRRRVVREARVHLGRPYDFFNFDLNDPRGFYCSKLVWLAVFRALGLALDGNPYPRRSFWFSPRQTMRSPALRLLLNADLY